MCSKEWPLLTLLSGPRARPKNEGPVPCSLCAGVGEEAIPFFGKATEAPPALGYRAADRIKRAGYGA